MDHYFTNNNLKNKIKKIDVNINNTKFYYYTDNGVFSKKKIDFGTELLLTSFSFINKESKVLDIGTGTGVIGLYFAKQGFKIVDMVDINTRAIELAKKAAQDQNLTVNVYESDCYEKVENKYDYIITNPPIRAGNKVIYKILIEANDNLNKSGELWFVIRKKQGAETAIKRIKDIYNISIINKKTGFYVIKCKKR